MDIGTYDPDYDFARFSFNQLSNILSTSVLILSLNFEIFYS